MRPPTGSERVVAVHEALAAATIPHAVGGAIALGHYAEPRPIRDIDVNVFVGPERRPEVDAALAGLGGDGAPVHLFFAADALHEAMPAAVRKVPFAGATIPIVGPEHLIVRKVMLDREKDWPDIEALLGSGEVVNLDEVRAWVERLAGAADERVARLDKLAPRG